jgi:hypothetical protein
LSQKPCILRGFCVSGSGFGGRAGPERTS